MNQQMMGGQLAQAQAQINNGLLGGGYGGWPTSGYLGLAGTGSQQAGLSYYISVKDKMQIEVSDWLRDWDE